MKKKLKIMVSLIGVLAMISANVVFAAESQKVPQKIQEIANGSDDIYGDGAPLEHVENGDERFQSGGIDHTHQYIVANALTILNNDKGGSLFNDELNDYNFYLTETSLPYTKKFNPNYKVSEQFNKNDIIRFDKSLFTDHKAIISGYDSNGYPLIDSNSFNISNMPFDLGWKEKNIKLSY